MPLAATSSSAAKRDDDAFAGDHFLVIFAEISFVRIYDTRALPARRQVVTVEGHIIRRYRLRDGARKHSRHDGASISADNAAPRPPRNAAFPRRSAFR